MPFLLGTRERHRKAIFFHSTISLTNTFSYRNQRFEPLKSFHNRRFWFRCARWSIVETIPDALLVLETDLRVRTANDSFYAMFQVRPDETEGTLVYELGTGQWDSPELRTLLEEILPENNRFIGFEVEHEFEDVGRRTMLLNGQRLDHVQLILLVMTDITQRKQAERALQESDQALRQLNESLEKQVAERTKQVRNLLTQVTMSEQAERRRISQLLHDDLQQHLHGLQFQLTFLSDALGNSVEEEDRAEALRTMATIEGGLLHSIQITRSLSVELSPPVLEGEGLTEAIRWLAAEMERHHGLSVQVQAADTTPVPQADLRVLLYQSVRELLFNIVKHAGVGEAMVVLDRIAHDIQIVITDSGMGFDVRAVLNKPGRSHGLWQIQRRLKLTDGEMEIQSTPDQGTRIVLTCPIPEEDE